MFFPVPYIGIFIFLSILIIVFGISFSGNCRGPKLFVHLVIMISISYVFRYDSAISSAEAFDAEYGLDGLKTSFSLAYPVFRLPNTSSVDICTNLIFGFLFLIV